MQWNNSILYDLYKNYKLQFNPLEFNHSATSNNMTLVHWPLMGGLLHWYSEERTGRGHSPLRPLLTVPNVTAHPSTASASITVLVYNGTLLCGFNVPIKVLNYSLYHARSKSVLTIDANHTNWRKCSWHLKQKITSSHAANWTITDEIATQTQPQKLLLH